MKTMISKPSFRSQIIIFLSFILSHWQSEALVNPKGKLHQRFRAFVPTCERILRQKQTLGSTDDSSSFLEHETFAPPMNEQLKQSIVELGMVTKRGFIATSEEKATMSNLISKLRKLNLSDEPAKSYYDNDQGGTTESDQVTLAGKWTLLYTNAPDITSLDTSNSILPSASKLGRIGQECLSDEKIIKNVIEWKRPDWVPSSSSTNDEGDNNGSRVLQKVCCKARAYPNEPNTVQLKLIGLELIGKTINTEENDDNPKMTPFFNTELRLPPELPSIQSILTNGPAAWFALNPLRLRRNDSSLTIPVVELPFGSFKILYLDETMRIIQTNQGYIAVNVRDETEWF